MRSYLRRLRTRRARTPSPRPATEPAPARTERRSFVPDPDEPIAILDQRREREIGVLAGRLNHAAWRLTEVIQDAVGRIIERKVYETLKEHLPVIAGSAFT